MISIYSETSLNYELAKECLQVYDRGHKELSNLLSGASMIYSVYLKSCDITGQHLQYLGSLKLVYKTDERYHALKTYSRKQLNFNTLMVRLYSKHKSC